jgi:hypothetical protein
MTRPILTLEDPVDLDTLTDMDFTMGAPTVTAPVQARAPSLRTMSFATYRAIKAVNYSSLKHLHVGQKDGASILSPLRYRYFADRPDAQKETDAMRLGKATHTAVFEPDRLLLEYVVCSCPDRKRKSHQACKARAVGRTLITEAQYETALAIRDAVRSHPLAAPYLERGEPEKTITWTDAVTGLRCKGRLDWLSTSYPCVVDLKTARDIDARAFGAAAARMGYHRQLAMYVAGAVANDLLIVPRAVIIAVENTPPHEVAVFTLNERDDAFVAGAEEAAELLACLKSCIESGEWPGRYVTEQSLELPFWLSSEENDSDTLEAAGFRRTPGE